MPLESLLMLDTAYGFELGPVLLGPTLASGEQTFGRREMEFAYFVGHVMNTRVIAVWHRWRSVFSETAATFIQGDLAMWMGRVTCTDKRGDITALDKSWGYKKDEAGALRIVLHHSSLPYQPE